PKWSHFGTASSSEGFLEKLVEGRGLEQRHIKKADSQQCICQVLTKVLGMHGRLISAMTSTTRQTHFRLALLQSRSTRSKIYTGTVSSQTTQTTKRSPPRGVVNRLERVISGTASSSEESSEPTKDQGLEHHTKTADSQKRINLVPIEVPGIPEGLISTTQTWGEEMKLLPSPTDFEKPHDEDFEDGWLSKYRIDDLSQYTMTFTTNDYGSASRSSNISSEQRLQTDAGGEEMKPLLSPTDSEELHEDHFFDVQWKPKYRIQKRSFSLPDDFHDHFPASRSSNTNGELFLQMDARGEEIKPLLSPTDFEKPHDEDYEDRWLSKYRIDKDFRKCQSRHVNKAFAQDEGAKQRQDDGQVLQWLERLESPEDETSGITISPTQHEQLLGLFDPFLPHGNGSPDSHGDIALDISGSYPYPPISSPNLTRPNRMETSGPEDAFCIYNKG
ncbi:MAG: hypothetical protein Q9228_005940, partial [Teloschistes exilis]